jgi:hypothetical protein
VFAPAVGQADDEQARALRQREHALAPGAGEQRLGHDAQATLHDQRRVGQQAARITAVGAVVGRCADEPQRGAGGRRDSRAQLECGPVVVRGPERDDDRARPQRADQQRHVAQRALEHRACFALERLGACVHQQQVDVLLRREPRYVAARGR